MSEHDTDMALVSAALRGGSFCIACIVKRTGVTKARVERILATLAETVKIARVFVVCDGGVLTREILLLD